MHSYTRYFLDKSKGFDRFIKKMYDKYQSLAKFSGTVVLDHLTEEEAKVLSRFFGTSYNAKDTISISIRKFLTIMENSKFEDFDIATFIQEYFHTPLVTNQEKRAQSLQEEMLFYQEILLDDQAVATSWLRQVLVTKCAPYSLLRKRYQKDKEALKKELLNIFSLLKHLPTEQVLLPIYASNHTSDPHYLDLDGAHAPLFLYALSFLDACDYPKTRAEKIALLSKYYIEVDYLSNYVLTYRLMANKNYMDDFLKQKEPLILNMQNIITMQWVDAPSKKVFIFENPSILTEILARDIHASVVIAGGFPNSCVYVLLDRLVEMGNLLFYNGDFDPEGLLIAQKLKNRYQEKIQLFCYRSSDYESCLSNKSIEESRLHKLSGVQDEGLMEIKNLLYSKKCAAYQENNKERIFSFLLDALD